MVEDTIDSAIHRFLGEGTIVDAWDLDGLKEHFLGLIVYKDDMNYSSEEKESLKREEIRSFLVERSLQAYDNKEAELTSETMREAERVVLLQIVDNLWMDHLDAMEQLRQGINLRAYAQRDPVVEYKFESFDIFEEMVNSIKEETVRAIYSLRLKNRQEIKREQVAKPLNAIHGDIGDAQGNQQPVVNKSAKVGRNDPCPCGSGKKYKKCCGADAE